MELIVDLHVHSHYFRATSKDCTILTNSYMSQINVNAHCTFCSKSAIYGVKEERDGTKACSIHLHWTHAAYAYQQYASGVCAIRGGTFSRSACNARQSCATRGRFYFDPYLDALLSQ